jgi:hypothetical protein
MVGASTSARPGRRAGAVSRGGRSGRRNPIVADGGGSSVVPRPSADAKRNKITVIVITPRRHCRRPKAQGVRLPLGGAWSADAVRQVLLRHDATA